MPKKTTRTTKAPETAPEESAAGFEAALGELEQLVERLEAGEQSLEEALKDFERGILLSRQCQGALRKAELRVQALLQHNGEESLEDFEADEADS